MAYRQPPGENVKRKMNKTATAVQAEVQEQAPVNRPVQFLLLGLWTANIAFFLYFLVRYGFKQPW